MALSDLEVNTIELIYDAMTAVNKARMDDANPRELRVQLGKLYRQLDASRSLLVNKHVETYLGRLESRSAELTAVTASVKKEIAKIERLAEAISKAAEAIKFVVNTGKGAISMGLL